MDHIPSMSAQSVVQEALYSLEKNRCVCINGFLNKALSVVGKIFPGRAAANIVELVLRKEVSQR